MTTAVYRLLNADGVLLYVGVTDNGMTRMSQHLHQKPWWPEVATTQWERHETREAALLAEEQAITTEAPLYNFAPRGRGRPYIGPKIEVRLQPELKAELEAIAEYSGWTLAELVRDILYQWTATGTDRAWEDAARRAKEGLRP